MINIGKTHEKSGVFWQLEIAAPQTERGWGATVWIGAASIVPVA